MTKELKNKKGFTLTELIVVIVIIGILAAVLIPSLTGYIAKAKESAVEQEASSLTTPFNTWLTEKEGKGGFTVHTTNAATKATESFVAYLTDEVNITTPGAVVTVTVDGSYLVTGFTYVKNGITITYSLTNGLTK